jgi:hypothetical protein
MKLGRELTQCLAEPQALADDRRRIGTRYVAQANLRGLLEPPTWFHTIS